jgi:hypothetical protein
MDSSASEKTMPQQSLFQIILSFEQNLHPLKLGRVNGKSNGRSCIWDGPGTTELFRIILSLQHYLHSFDVRRSQQHMRWAVVSEKTQAMTSAVSNRLFNSTVLTIFDVERSQHWQTCGCEYEKTNTYAMHNGFVSNQSVRNATMLTTFDVEKSTRDRRLWENHATTILLFPIMPSLQNYLLPATLRGVDSTCQKRPHATRQ